MNEPLKISILVAIYKSEPYIEKCAHSLFSQDYNNLEFIFVDDYSPDNSLQKLKNIISLYPNRKEQVKIIQNTKNEGLANVRNIQIAEADGDYLLFVDSDDWIDQEAIKSLSAEAAKTKSDIICYDLLNEFSDHTEYYSFGNRNKEELLKDVSSGKLKSYLVLFLTKRSIYIENNLIFNPKIRICEDIIMFYKLMSHISTITYHHQAFYHYFRGNPNSNTVISIQNITDRINGILEIEKYLKSTGTYRLLKKELNIRKFDTKKEFIVNKQFRDFNKWRKTFKEASFSWQGSNIGRRNKLACLLVIFHLDRFATLLLKN